MSHTITLCAGDRWALRVLEAAEMKVRAVCAARVLTLS